MANYACKYVESIDKFLSEEHSKEEISEMVLEHIRKISFFQHERLVHLIVTVLFAVMDVIMLAVSFFAFNFSCVLLMVFFTMLLIPYIFHYYFLENSVQKMYVQYDMLRTKMK